MEIIELSIPGSLKLDVKIERQATGEVDVNGCLGFTVMTSVNAVADMVPFGFGRRLTSNFISRFTWDDNYTIKIPGLLMVDVNVNQSGIMSKEVKYLAPFVRAITEGETERIFYSFSDELKNQGIQPCSKEIFDEFLANFKQRQRTQLDFAALFRGKWLEKEGMSPYTMESFEIHTTEVTKDENMDLLVHFQGTGTMVVSSEEK